MSTRLLLSIASAFLWPAAPALAQDAGKVTTTTVLMSGKPLGVGGGARGGFGILNVCRAEKVNAESVEVAVASALDKFGLSLDPPTLEVFSALALGKAWRTSPSSVTEERMREYDAVSARPLPSGYNYYVTYEGQVGLKGRSLVLSTVTSLRYGGASSVESQPFKGDFNHGYFHAALEATILKEIEDYGCQ